MVSILRQAAIRADSIKASAIRKMLELSNGIKNLVHLEQGEPDFKTPTHIIEAAVKFARIGFTHYTEAEGTLELREAIAEKLRKENGVEVDPQTEVTVTSGTQEAMLITALSFLNRGDEALILDPYYPAYFEDTLIAEAKPVTIPLEEDNNFSVKTKALEEKITEKTKIIWICNPCNPTGHVYSKTDLEAVARVAKKHDLIVFSDEIYEKLVYDDAKHLSIASFPGMESRTITVNGFSKTYAMTGWRIGYMTGERKISATLRKLHYYMALCPNAISQKAAHAALAGSQDCIEEMRNEYLERRELMFNELNKFDLPRRAKPKGAFYFFPDFSSFEESDETFALRLLKEAAVVTVPGSGFGEAGKGHLRISYSTPFEQIKKGMKRIERCLNIPT